MVLSTFLGDFSGVLVMVALGMGTPLSLRANPADILLVDGKIVTRDATSSTATRSPATAVGLARQVAGGDTEACRPCQRRELIRVAFALWVSSFGGAYNATSLPCAPKDGPSQLPPT
jgi:hypothetical protein